MSTQFIDEDFVALRRTATGSGKPFLTLSFGDAVEVLPDTQNEHPGFTRVRALSHFDGLKTFADQRICRAAKKRNGSSYTRNVSSTMVL